MERRRFFALLAGLVAGDASRRYRGPMFEPLPDLVPEGTQFLFAEIAKIKAVAEPLLQGYVFESEA